MQKKFLQTYTLLGLMLCWSLTPVTGGIYEKTFLDEVKSGCLRFQCNPKNHGSERYEDTVSTQIKIGESKSGYHTIEHYKTGSGTITRYKAADYSCDRCHQRFGEEWPILKQPKFDVNSNDTHIQISKTGTFRSPCILNKFYNYEREDYALLAKIYKNSSHYNSWAKMLDSMWKVSVQLDKEYAVTNERISLEKGNDPRLDSGLTRTVAEEEGCCCQVM